MEAQQLKINKVPHLLNPTTEKIQEAFVVYLR